MRYITFIIIFFCLLFFTGCKENYVPKPRGYFRINFPEKGYTLFDTICPYKFLYPIYAKIENDKEKNSRPCWININYPDFNAKIHISYIPVRNNLGTLLEDTYTLAYKHVQKADAINNNPINIPDHHVYGIYYDIKGNVASSKQFYLTDSINHYLRGALYFYEQPNKDSLAPVIDFIDKDIKKMIESFEWKN